MIRRPLVVLLLVAAALSLAGCDKCGNWDFSVCKQVETR